MPFAAGTRLGPYEVVSLIGEGGMGQVYRATDLNLKRTVALKVLPDAVAGDADRLARFQREAEVLAALNHPNIAAIYGLERSGTVTALVMELVEGDDLSTIIARGMRTPEVESVSSRPRDSNAQQARGGGAPRGMNIDDALKIARQIAEALEAAHENGIVHRDLKPANIKVRPDDTVKVLDFGLAKARGQELSSSSGTQATTLSPARTEIGTILGTAAYMAPEQAKGRPVDRRADVWAFGAVLYEMVTGARAFAGDDITEVLASVLAREPDWSKLPADAPAINGVIRRCLERDPRQRFGDMQSVRLALGGAFTAGPVTSAPALVAAPATVPAVRARSGALAWGIAATAVIAASALGVAYVNRPAPEAPLVFKSSILPPQNVTFDFDVTVGPATISPNGRLIAFSGREPGGRIQLWVRPIDSTDARPITGTDGASFPFWSPDSQEIGFYSAARGRLERVVLAGGAPIPITRAGYVRGACWGPDGTVLYDTSDGGGQIMEVAIADGTPKSLIHGNGNSRSPWLLPDGRHFLYSDRDTRQIHVASRDGTSDNVLTDATSHAVYTAGHLIFMRESALLAQSFDPTTLQLRGSAQAIASDVQMLLGDARGVFSASDTGTLLYLDGAGTSSMTLAWFDDKGTRAGVVGEVGSARGVRLSPDGRTASIGLIDVEGRLNLWTIDVATHARTQLTFGRETDALGSFTVWSLDGRSLMYSVRRDNAYAIARRPSAGGAEEILFTLPTDQNRLANPRVSAWTNDGSTILYSGSSVGGIWSLPLTPDASGKRAAQVLVGDLQAAQNVRLRPGDRWFSYQGGAADSTVSGIFVEAYPGAGHRQQVAARGSLALWGPDGKSLYYADDNILTVVSVTEADGALRFGPPRAIMPVVVGRGYSYDVSKDGRILALVSN